MRDQRGPERPDTVRVRPDCRSAIYHRASVVNGARDGIVLRHGVGAEPDVLDAPAEGRAPVVVLGAIVVGAFLLYALLTTGVDGPRVHPDEELYTMGASSLAAGDGLTLRGAALRLRPSLPG